MGAYIKKTISTGNLIEVQKYYAPRYGSRNRTRAENRNATPPDVAAVNERRSLQKLRWLLNGNFARGDFHAQLTYREEDRPDEPEARIRLQKFLREARKYMTKQGCELKYIHVTEYETTAIHHHIVVNMPLSEIMDLWPWGLVRGTPLDGRDYTALATYLIKETRRSFRSERAPFARRYCGSRNLVQPVVRTEVVHAESWRREPKPIRGYQIVPQSIETGTHEVTGQAWQRYWMRRIE